MNWIAHSETPFANAQKAVIDVSGLSEKYRDGQKLRQEYEERQQQKALNEIMKVGDHNGRLDLAKQHRYAGALVPLLQKYEEDRQKSALENLKTSSEIGKVYGETSKLGAETGKIGAETGKIGAETTGLVRENTAGIQNDISALAVTQNPKLFALGIGEMVKQGLINPERADTMLKMVATDQPNAAAVLQAMVVANPELAKLFKPEVTYTNLGNRVESQVYNPLANTVTGKGGYSIGQSPDNKATNATSLANNQNTVAAGERNNIRTTDATNYGTNVRANTASEQTAVDWYEAETGAAVAQQNAETNLIKANNVGTGGVDANGNPVARKLEANERTELFELQEQIDADIGVGESLKRLNELSDQSYSGLGASFRGTAASRLPGGASNQRANATVLSENITIELALKQLKSTFGAAPTEGERKILMDLQASVDKSPVQKKQIIAAAMRAVAERIRYRKKRQEAIRTGSYAIPKGSGSSSAKPKAQNNAGASIIGGILGGG